MSLEYIDPRGAIQKGGFKPLAEFKNMYTKQETLATSLVAGGNVTSGGNWNIHFTVVGKHVVGSFHVLLNVTAANTNTLVGVVLPDEYRSLNFSGTEDGMGVCTAYENNMHQAGYVYSENGSKRLILQFHCLTDLNPQVRGTFTFESDVNTY